MAQRRYGPTQGAGIAVIEKESDKTIEPAALGVVGYIGVCERGPVGELSEILSKAHFAEVHGGYISESLLPDASNDFWNLGKGAGREYIVRITDGTEKQAEIILKSRKSPRTETMKIKGHNGGRWAGKKQSIICEYLSVTQTTLSTGKTMLEDELKDALVTLEAVPGKSFKVVSNDTAGILTFASDVKLLDEIGSSTDKLCKVSLINEGKAISVLIKNGLIKPLEEFGIEIYDNGVLVKTYNDLSVNPDAPNYYVSEINDDTGNFWILVEDLHVGAILADVRPANYHGKVSAISTTKLTAKIYEEVVNSISGAKAEIITPDYGAGIIKGKLSLVCTSAGARAVGLLTFPGQPADADTIVINGKTITFKTVVVDATAEVLIGATAEATLDNLVAFMLVSVDVLIKNVVFAEKKTASTVDLFACIAGVVGNTITTTSAGGGTQPTWGGATLLTGSAQTWSVTHDQLGTLVVFTSDVTYAKANNFVMGFDFIDTTKDSSKAFAVDDSIDIYLDPFEPNILVNEILVPDVSERRKQFVIDSNTAYEIEVSVGNDLTSVADIDDYFMLMYGQELGGGYDGLAGLADSHYLQKLSAIDSPFNELFGKNVGLVKLASPGVSSTQVQKAGASYAESRNCQWRYECPSNIVTETAAEQWLNDTVGRNDFAVFCMNAWHYVTNPLGGNGLKLSPTVGSIHGREAKMAKDYDGYHKAGSDVTATLPNTVKLTTGDRALNEEFLNPQGIQVIKKIKGNFTIWGDRTVGTDPAFKFKHKREYMSHQENILRENFDWIVFAINSRRAITQQLAATALRAHFLLEYNKNALEGDSFTDAFSLKMDEENNNRVTRAQGDLNAEIRFRIVDTVERFIITMSQLGIFESIES